MTRGGSAHTLAGMAPHVHASSPHPSTPSNSRGGGGSFLGGLVLGVVVGFCGGVLAGTKGCPPDPVPAGQPRQPATTDAKAVAP
jgi:predicted lipid-binding transport protein (Tim44 family)